jgi:hypothetical protein
MLSVSPMLVAVVMNPFKSRLVYVMNIINYVALTGICAMIVIIQMNTSSKFMTAFTV